MMLDFNGVGFHNENRMTIVGREVLTQAATKHPDAAKALGSWLAEAERAAWESLRDVRSTYPHADGVKLASKMVVTIFNIRGNAYRLLTVIAYAQQVVVVKMLLTHAEYNKDKWKRLL